MLPVVIGRSLSAPTSSAPTVGSGSLAEAAARQRRSRRCPGRKTGAARRLAQAGDDVLACVERGLTAEQAVHLGVEGLLVEELAAGQPVDVGAERRNPVLVGLLHPALAGDGRGKQVVAEDEVARRGEIEDGEEDTDDRNAARKPGPDRKRADVLSASDDDAVRRLAAGERTKLAGAGNRHTPSPRLRQRTRVRCDCRLEWVKVNKVLAIDGQSCLAAARTSST